MTCSHQDTITTNLWRLMRHNDDRLWPTGADRCPLYCRSVSHAADPNSTANEHRLAVIESLRIPSALKTVTTRRPVSAHVSVTLSISEYTRLCWVFVATDTKQPQTQDSVVVLMVSVHRTCKDSDIVVVGGVVIWKLIRDRQTSSAARAKSIYFLPGIFPQLPEKRKWSVCHFCTGCLWLEQFVFVTSTRMQ